MVLPFLYSSCIVSRYGTWVSFCYFVVNFNELREKRISQVITKKVLTPRKINFTNDNISDVKCFFLALLK